ncbi:2,3-diaminopropionate biosynthesis protein SbnB [Streptomyces tendae]|uniref:2,3-diaminopropionate biosynthesis protein SbnB n=1 Tax=Streptomyces tendae TaxID=1932 RepID=UPI0037220970
MTALPTAAEPPEPEFTVIGGPVTSDIIARQRKEIADIVRTAYVEHHRGRSVNPRSHFLRFPHKPNARIIALPAYLARQETAGIKWISSFPDNIAGNLPRASSVLVLNDYGSGYPFACLESSHISAARTAASAVLAAAGVFGSRAPRRALFVGAGVLGRTIADFLAAGPWTMPDCEVFDLDPAYAGTLAAHIEAGGARASAVTDLEAAVRRSDLLVLATTAATPWLTDPEWLRPGQCVLNVSLRDLAPEVILAARNIVDDVEHCLNANTSPHLAEQLTGGRDFIDGTIAELLLGEVEVPLDRPVVVSPFGLGVLDLAVGLHVYRSAVADGTATPVPGFFGQPRRWESV